MTGRRVRDQAFSAFAASDFLTAAAIIEAFLAEAPEDDGALFLLGAARHRTNQLDLAKEAFQEAARLNPRHLQAQLALAAVCMALGEPVEAIRACETATQLAASDPSTWHALAVAQEAAAQRQEALESYDRALALQPLYFDALNNRGVLLLALGKTREAIENNRFYVARQPYSTQAYFNLGSALLADRNYSAAADAFLRAQRLSPDNAKMSMHAGFALAQCERFIEAQRLLDHAATREPELQEAYRAAIFGGVSGDSIDAKVLFLLRHYDAIERCDWRERDYFLSRFGELIAEAADSPLCERALGFRAMALGLSPALQQSLANQIAVGIARHATAGQSRMGQVDTVEGGEPPFPKAQGRVRIGYVSGCFHRHATAFLMARLPELHDRASFEVFLYATGPDDGSELRRQLVAGADHFADVRTLPDHAVASRIEHDGIDILVDLDGYTQDARPVVFALRPAPVQVAYLGYLQTQGGGWIDYAILDHHVMHAPLRPYWNEKIAYLPDTLYLCDDSEGRAGVSDRTAWGLPDEAFVFCCLNASWKIEPESLACWVAILEKIPASVLWLYASNGEAERNLRDAFRGYGLSDARLVFCGMVPHEIHLDRFRCADVFLDTFSCNAHTTAIEALAAGVPVVTLKGETVVARVGASLLMAHGLQDLVQMTPEAYVAMACRLAGDQAYLAQVQARTRNRRSSRLFSTLRRVRELETAYRMMWARYEAGLPPEDLLVPAKKEGVACD
jgi:protein O-GlcNAc transferase